ncbi:MAG: hypothetical protein Q8R01_13535 [Ramlibacter sp.]|nr:hypothetical protein [Ramlibacter sp.]
MQQPPVVPTHEAGAYLTQNVPLIRCASPDVGKTLPLSDVSA